MTHLSPVEHFVAVCATCTELFEDKNDQYGNAIVKTGVLGATVELIGVINRLPNMVLKDTSHGREQAEKLRDIFMDIHNYASIAIMMLDDNNWEGE